MMKKIVYWEGVGDLASRGVKYLSDKIDKKSSEFAIHVKGHELAAWNVHVSAGTGISYATSNRGACHLNGSNPREQNINAMIDSLGLCNFAYFGYGNEGLRELIAAILGIDFSANDLLKTGDRIFNIEKLFNYNEGFGAEDDKLPERFFKEPLSYGKGRGKKLNKIDFYDKRLKRYYMERGWDIKTTKPTKSKLKELEIV
jgi:aldehyde:ferredoxin oxidoreductase